MQSVPGKGTTFSLYFPVTRKSAENERSAPSIERLKGHGETILIVDDVEEQRRICTLLSSKLGYVVHAVSSGDDAVAYMRTYPTDLVILDMIMELPVWMDWIPTGKSFGSIPDKKH